MTGCLTRLDPERSRRSGVAAQAVILADGRAWGLALPEPRFRPEFGWARSAGPETEQPPPVGVRFGYPWTIERLVERLESACRATPGPSSDRERFDALMALASALLRRAHDLDPIEAAVLLALDGDGPTRLVDAVLDAVDRRAAPSPPGGADD